MNDREKKVAAALEAEGWEVLHRGWPDFLAIRGDQVRFIEVKPVAGDAFDLVADQRRVAEILKTIGIEVEVQSHEWTEKDRLQEIADIDAAMREDA